MHNKDFENKVQQKMQELRFAPSEEVWMRVEAGIEKKKRKRRFAFWMLLPLIISAGVVLFVKREASGVRNETSNVKEPVLSVAKDETSNVKEPVLSVVKDETSGVKSEMKIAKIFTKEAVLQETKEVANDSAVSAVELEQTNIEEIEKQEEVKDVKEEELLEVKEETISKKIKSSSKWHFGIEASAGISSFTKGLLQSHAQTAGYYYDPIAYGNNTPATVFKPSDAKQGFAFSAGIFASRSVSKKLDIRLGLSYMHATTSMKIGQKVDSVRAVNQSNMSMDKVDGYYAVGTSNHYTNKYSLIGISASLDWHVTRRLSWQNGIHFARLVNSNALHFDGLTGSYYENDRLFNKNQVLASTSIQFNVFKKISVGPEARFALTDMLKNNSNDKKHMRYVGVKSVFTLK